MIKRALLVSLLPLFAGCVAQNGTATDTNTNWLGHCSEAADCGDELSCLCGVCSIECANTKDCRKQDAAAVCVTKDSCAEATSICGKASAIEESEEPDTAGTESAGTESASDDESEANAAPSVTATEPDPGTDNSSTVAADECLTGLQTADAYLQEVLAAAATSCFQDSVCSSVNITPSCAGECTQDVAMNDEAALSFGPNFRESWLNSCAAVAECGFNVNCVQQEPSEARCQFPESTSNDDSLRAGTCVMVPLDNSCAGLAERADRKLMAALDNAWRGCRDDSECQEITMPSLSCIFDAGECGQLVPANTARVGELEGAVQMLENTICSAASDQKCTATEQGCAEVPPPGPRKVICLQPSPDEEGMCTYPTLPPEDDGPSAPGMD